MVKIYTKTGDDGTTALFDGSRVLKDDWRVEAYASVDELNAVVGQAVVAVKKESDLADLLLKIQSDLFALGAKLANPAKKKQKQKADFPVERVTVLEKAIDVFETELSKLTSFILPGGCEAAALLHVARTSCRRAERRVVTLLKNAPTDEPLLIYLNRLSDLLFVMARVANARAGVNDVPWVG